MKLACPLQTMCITDYREHPMQAIGFLTYQHSLGETTGKLPSTSHNVTCFARNSRPFTGQMFQNQSHQSFVMNNWERLVNSSGCCQDTAWRDLLGRSLWDAPSAVTSPQWSWRPVVSSAVTRHKWGCLKRSLPVAKIQDSLETDLPF